MSEDARSPAPYASDIDAARERLVAFASGCTDDEWRAAPVDGDPRPVGVIVDHVAHSYEYLAGWSVSPRSRSGTRTTTAPRSRPGSPPRRRRRA